MTEKLLNSSVKQSLDASPNTLLFGNAIIHEPSIVEELDQTHNNATPVSIRSYVDAFMLRQEKLLNAAMRSQEKMNVRNLQKRYANYKRLLGLRIRRIREDIEEEHEEPRDRPTSIAHIIAGEVKPVQPIFITKRWTRTLDPAIYIRLVDARDTEPEADSIAEIDTNSYTEYEVRDYELRRYPTTKIGYSNPNKYGSWWRGPYLVTAVSKVPIVYGLENL